MTNSLPGLVVMSVAVHAARRDSSASTDKSVVIEREVMSRFEDLLELRDRALARGLPRLADYYTDRIIDGMVGR